MLKPKMIEMFFEKHEGAKWLTFLSLPMALLSGWFVYLTWVIGISGWGNVIVVSIALLSGITYLIRTTRWELMDLRWLIAPILIISLSSYIPWWEFTHAWPDSGHYTYWAINFIEQSSWLPPDFRLLPPLVPGFLSLEIFYSKQSYSIRWVPIILFIASSWQIQHLAERLGTMKSAILCMIIFILLPVTRYWGQMVMTDVAVAGMWVLCLHIFLLSEENDDKINLAMILGVIAAITFLTKYTHIYLVGIGGWMVLRDWGIGRAKKFFMGWLIITAPFIIQQLILHGHPFYPLIDQVQFAVISTTSTVDVYTSSNFVNDILSEITLLLVIGASLGIYQMYNQQKRYLITITVMVVPLLILNGIILDWGEPRYNTPIIAIILLLCTYGCKRVVSDYQEITNNSSSKLISILCAGLLLTTGIFHFTTLSDESENANDSVEQFQSTIEFIIQPLSNLNQDDILLAGKDKPIRLKTKINTIRYIWPSSTYKDTNDPIIDGINAYKSTHMLTTNVQPYFTWEKDFDWQLGHGSIELETIHTDGWWSAVLWRVDNTTYLSPNEYYSNHTGNVTGDLLILGPNESFTVGDNNLSIKWIEVTTIRPYQQVMKTLAGEEGLMTNGSIDGGEDSFFYSHEQLISPPNKYIYAWILPHSL